MADQDRREPFWMYGYPEDYEPDQFDDAYYAWQRNRKPVSGLLRIEELSRKLQQESEDQRTIPPPPATDLDGS